MLEKIGRGERICTSDPLVPNSVESAANSLVWYRLRILGANSVAPMHPSAVFRLDPEEDSQELTRHCATAQPGSDAFQEADFRGG